ncbi:tumor protein D54-like [Dysidea avara]|uniref:tumor protein D54-like n=1 Tax=Dysidea avara TaxID=196820 RepID=UPI00332CDBA2
MATDTTGYDGLETNTSPPNETSDLTDQPLSPTSPEDDIQLEPTEEEMRTEELKERMRQLQVEIGDLYEQLQRKDNELSEVKKELGITPFTEFKESIATGMRVIGNKWKEIQETGAYRKTNEKLTGWKDKLESSERYQKTKGTLNEVGSKTSTAISKAGSSISSTTSSAYHKVKENERIQNMGSAIRSTSIKLKDRVMGTSIDKGDETAAAGEEVVVPDEQPKHDI